jgi:geranylgeranyl reductase family protein
MIRADAVVVGGGPAGSTCAGALRRAGWDVLVIDRARFPRDKVCAGWLTPQVWTNLALTPDEYRATGLTLQEIRAFRTGVFGGAMMETTYPGVVSYGILRREFDHFLLQRANVRVLDNTPVHSLRRRSASWVINDAIETPVLIGAGGHFCPVAQHLRGGADTARPIVAKEAEFRRRDHAGDADGAAPALFFCRDLDGYAWCVPKGDYLNVGIGRRDSRDFAAHVREFIAFLEAHGVHAADAGVHWHGHAYFAAGTSQRPLIEDGALLIGDAAGLAYPESGEGILPAIESAQLAARTLIAAGGRYQVDALQPYADAIRQAHPPSRRTAHKGAASALVGRLLLRSAAFTRHVVLNRWFLHADLHRAATAGTSTSAGCGKV